MTLLAESGSTKTEWRYRPDGSAEWHSLPPSDGLNPFILTSEQIVQKLDNQLRSVANEVRTVYFYGAGCADDTRCNMVRAAFRSICPQADIYIESDLLAAARATCGNAAGIVCILGTGANSAVFDGRDFTDRILPLGYIVGDEGSGAYLGKKLMQAFFYRELPLHLHQKLAEKFPNGRTDLLDALKTERPNAWLAAWVPFIAEHIAEPAMHDLVREAFDAFLRRQILKYPAAAHLPVHFVGSVAAVFEAILRDEMRRHNLRPGLIRQHIIGPLEAYHSPIA